MLQKRPETASCCYAFSVQRSAPGRKRKRAAVSSPRSLPPLFALCLQSQRPIQRFVSNRAVVALAVPRGPSGSSSPPLDRQIPESEGSRRRACSDPEPFPLSYSSRLSLLSRLSEPAPLALVLPSGFDASAGIVTPRSFVVRRGLGTDHGATGPLFCFDFGAQPGSPGGHRETHATDERSPEQSQNARRAWTRAGSCEGLQRDGKGLTSAERGSPACPDYRRRAMW